MRTHRIIFWTTLLLFIIFAPIVINLNIDNDIKNILIGIICSSLVSSIVELPNLLNYKSNCKNNIYNSLLFTKLFLLQYNNDINNKLKENDFNYNQYGSYYLNNISNYINLFNKIDNTIFISNKKKKELLNNKKDFFNLYNSTLTESLRLDIYKMNLQLNNCTIEDLHIQLKKINSSNNKLINKIDSVAENILNKKQLNYFIDNSKRITEALKNEANK
jgi:hypothetical protein